MRDQKGVIVVAWVVVNLVVANSGVLNRLGVPLLTFAVGMWFPALSAAALLLAGRRPLRAGLNLRAGPPWAVGVAVGFAVAVATLTAGLALASREARVNAAWTLGVGGAIATWLLWCLASLGEELAWRGYLHNAWRGWRHAPAAIGLVWGAWHVGSLARGGASLAEIGRFFVLTLLLSYLLSWLVRRGAGVWTCTAFHGTWNFLRLKVLEGQPDRGHAGLLLSENPGWTAMEGGLGLMVTAVLAAGFVVLWYREGPSHPPG